MIIPREDEAGVVMLNNRHEKESCNLLDALVSTCRGMNIIYLQKEAAIHEEKPSAVSLHVCVKTVNNLPAMIFYIVATRLRTFGKRILSSLCI
jgi:hypothetical protein